MKQFAAFVRKEFLHVFRDRKTLLLLFGMPVVQILLFGFALTNEIRNCSIVICDYSKDHATMRITEMLNASRYFDILESVHTTDKIDEDFRSGKIKLAVVFPSGFENDLIRLNKAQVQIIADASDPNTATTLTNYAARIIADYNRELTGNLKMPVTITTDVRMIYNPELKGATNFVPGVMALVLLLVCVLMTSVSIVREKETGTMEVLLVSPFNPLLVVISKAVPYFFLSLINLTVIIVLSITLLDLPVRGSLLLLYFASSLLIFTALSLGLLISAVTSSQQEAMVVSLLGMLLPTMIFTGFLFPLENMPAVLQYIAYAVPSKWYYSIVKDVMIKGLGISSVWKEMLVLCAMAAVFLIVSIRKFNIRLQ